MSAKLSLAVLRVFPSLAWKRENNDMVKKQSAFLRAQHAVPLHCE